MPEDLHSYQWECPICGTSQASLSTADRGNIEDHVRNDLLSHVRSTDGGGHGPEGDLPPGFDPAEDPGSVELDREVDDTPVGTD